MQKRHIVYNIQGMGQDVVSSPLNTTMAYSIKNMRLTPTKDSNALELTTECGTKPIYADGDNFPFDVTILGYCTLQQYLVLFLKGEKQYDNQNHWIGGPDYIYRLEQDDNGDYVSKCLFEGDLNFSEDSNIEATSYYENENVLKVYWVDGINQPRLINIANATTLVYTNGVYTGYDFMQAVLRNNCNANIKVRKLYTGGNFTSGVIQYAYSLYGQNALETPILDTTSLCYITHSDRGGAPNEQCGCCFEITIQNINILNDDKFDYIRIYSILRNSLNGTPLARVVADVPFNNTITIVDDGNSGYDIDYNLLQYQRLPIHPLTLTLKDNVLFVGNYNIDNTVDEMTKLYIYDKNPTDINNPYDPFDDNSIYIASENWWPGLNDQQYKVNVYDTNAINIYPWHNQLDTESAGVKTFKYMETYKLGVLFQDIYGNWSQPYFIRDVLQEKYPLINNGELHKPIFQCNIRLIYNKLKDWEKDLYVRIRPVVSFPSITERSMLYQGVLNPTVFNITDRINKIGYSQSSWFFRPESNISITNNDTYETQSYGAINEFIHYNSLFCSDDIGSEIQGMFFDDYSNNINHNTNIYNMGWNYWLDNTKDPIRPRIMANQIIVDDSQKYKNFYFVDKSVISLNSPDILFNNVLLSFDEDNLDIVGYIQLLANVGNYNIISLNPNFKLSHQDDNILIRDGSYMADGYKNFQILNSYDNLSPQLNYGILSSVNSWFDDFCVKDYPDLNSNMNMQTIGVSGLGGSNDMATDKWNRRLKQYSFMIYPWQRQYLNNYKSDSVDSESSKIQSKYLSNFRFSIDTQYFDTDNIEQLDTKIISLCKDDVVRLKDNKFYISNYNKYLLYNSEYNGITTPYDYSTYFNPGTTKGWLVKTGYPIMVKGFFGLDMSIIDNLGSGIHNDISFLTDYYEDYRMFIKLSKVHPLEIETVGTWKYSIDYDNHYISSTAQPERFTFESNAIPQSSDSILLQYKSSDHLVIQLNDIIDEFYNKKYHQLLPTLYGSGNTILYYNNDLCWSDENDLSYDGDIVGSYQKHLGVNNVNGYLLIANITKPISESYLNTWNNGILSNESNLYIRNWIPCGKPLGIPNEEDSLNLIAWIEGDTYYQRYDCVKTKPYNENDYQAVIEVLSFMVESNINLDGRYDKNRGILDYTIISDDNFNLFNEVYNQENNFFTYHILDPNKFNIDEFRNDIVWSAKKISGESVDQWTKLSSINQLQLDGNKGYVKALRKFNDNIYCFQDHAISRIRFNDRTAITTELGIPLLLAYTNYVDGYEYVNSDIGCQYGISCCETENGIFFIDNDIPGIYKMSYNEYGNINVRSLTKERLMQRWFENYGNIEKTRVFFDKPVNEILSICNLNIDEGIKGYCISFSCDMNSFQLFIDYEKAKYILTHNNIPIAITDTNGLIELWKLRNGSFVSFFGQYRRPYGLKIVASPPRASDGLILDCIYDSLSYKADVFVGSNGDFDPDTYQPNESFDTLEVSSIYQTGEQTQLEYTNQPSHLMSNLRKKFGSWFARIPRFNDMSLLQGRYNKEHIRGSKLMISLMKDKPKVTNHKLILKELSVDCFY